jgi:hypothetical protein
MESLIVTFVISGGWQEGVTKEMGKKDSLATDEQQGCALNQASSSPELALLSRCSGLP